MVTTVQCDIVSADESLFSGSVQMVVATGSLGEMGIMPGHAPLLSDLRPGPVRLVKDGGDEEVYCLLYTSPSPRDVEESRMPSSA